MTRPLRTLIAIAVMSAAILSLSTCRDTAPPAESAAITYTCPMHPNVRQDHPGQCPICHMDLVPLSAASNSSGDVTVHGRSRVLAGMTLTAASVKRLERRVRAPGRVALDQTRVFDVTLRIGGYVARLFADAEGTLVAANGPVLWLDSPELVAAQAELLRASAHSGGEALAVAATQRLRVWGMTDAQIDDVKKSGQPLDPVPITSAQSGVVVEKDVVVGQRVEAGQRVARLARLDKVWIEADVFPDDARAITVGQPAEVRVLGDAGPPLAGKVSRVLPRADDGARTVRVRVDVTADPKNETRLLVPGAAVVVEVVAQARDALMVPRDAVIRTGTRDVVFVDAGNDALALRPVTLGAHDTDHVEIVAGLKADERVVTRAAFLVAAESRLRVPTQWDAPPEGGP